MSGIAIPGVNSRFNTEEMVANLVKAEAVKLDTLKKDREKLEFQKTAWQDLNRNLADLRNVSRTFYSFESPFNERIATPSAPGFVTATASREAVEGTTRFEIKQLAAADRLISDPLPRNREIPAGTYDFTIGEETISFRYRGGTVSDFATNLSRRAPTLLKASVVQTTVNESVLLIESLKPGAANPLEFKGESVALGLELGLITKNPGTSAPVTGLEDDRTFEPGASANFSPAADSPRTRTTVLEFTYRYEDISAEEAAAANPGFPGPALPSNPVTTLRDASITDLGLDLDLPDVTPPPPPAPVRDDRILVLGSRGKEISAVRLPDSSEARTIQVPLEGNAEVLDRITVENKNTLRRVIIGDARLFDRAVDREYLGKNPASTAQDAVIMVDGIRIERPTNVVDDVIPGVSLALESPTERAIQIKVEPDRETVKDSIIEFVGRYNAVQREINIMTARAGSNEIINELTYLTEDEKKLGRERLGLYQGDTTMLMIKSRLQNITSNAYPTSLGSNLAVLGQMGVSTNASGGSTGIQATNLRGYLEINEKLLDQALAEKFLAVKELFGRDNDNDLLVDNGVGFQLESYLRPYTQTGGIIVGRTNTLDTQMRAKDTEIKNYEAYLERYESDLKQKYGQMEGAINRLEASSSELNKLNSNNNR